MATVAKTFSVVIYWIENILFIGVFAAVELALYPVVYLKSIINVAATSSSIGAKAIIVNLAKFLTYG